MTSEVSDQIIMRRLTKCIHEGRHRPEPIVVEPLDWWDTAPEPERIIGLRNCRWCGISRGFTWGLSERRVIALA